MKSVAGLIYDPVALAGRTATMLTAVFVVIAIVIFWFWWVKRRGDEFVRRVAYTTALVLREDGESEETITAFLNSAEFSALAKSAFGSVDHYRAANDAIAAFHGNTVFWRRAGGVARHL